MEGPILAVGDAVLDLLCTPLPALPEGDLQIHMDRIVPSPGGNTLNFALAAAAIFPGVVFHGAVGDDPFGDILLKMVSEKRLDARIERLRGVGTAITVAIPDPKGGRRLLTHPGANAVFDPDQEGIPLESAIHLHRGGYWFTERLMGEKNIELLRTAREAGVETSMDPATDPKGWDGGRIGPLLTSFEFVDVLFLNKVELRGISGCDGTDEGIETLLELGCGTVVLHLGDRGVRWKGRLGSGSMAAFPLEVIRNPTGSGDVFNGAFVASRVSSADVEEAMAMGQAAAALHIIDPMVPYPSRDRIDRFRYA